MGGEPHRYSPALVGTPSNGSGCPPFEGALARRTSDKLRLHRRDGWRAERPHGPALNVLTTSHPITARLAYKTFVRASQSPPRERLACDSVSSAPITTIWPRSRMPSTTSAKLPQS